MIEQVNAYVTAEIKLGGKKLKDRERECVDNNASNITKISIFLYKYTYLLLFF